MNRTTKTVSYDGSKSNSPATHDVHKMRTTTGAVSSSISSSSCCSHRCKSNKDDDTDDDAIALINDIRKIRTTPTILSQQPPALPTTTIEQQPALLPTKARDDDDGDDAIALVNDIRKIRTTIRSQQPLALPTTTTTLPVSSVVSCGSLHCNNSGNNRNDVNSNDDSENDDAIALIHDIRKIRATIEQQPPLLTTATTTTTTATATPNAGQQRQETLSRPGSYAVPGMTLNHYDDSSCSDSSKGASGRQNDWDTMESGVYGGQDEEDLVVAFEVEEDDDDAMCIPSAVEYDPDAKPPMYRNRRFRLYALLGIFVVILATVGAVVGTIRADYSPPPPLPDRAVLGIRENIEQLVGTAVLEDASNPYSRALNWIQNVDAMALTPDNSTFYQRYILAYLYYATSGRRPWAGGCGPSDNPDASASCFFDQTTVGRGIEKVIGGVSALRWLSAGNECEWLGVVCDELNQVFNLRLGGTNMTGTFPEGIMLLPGLQELDLGIGELQGTIPAHLGSMKHLRELKLYYNQFTGTVPESLYRSRVLQVLNVGGNKLQGRISTSLIQLSDLRGYYIFENQIAGSIPRELFDLQNLQYLYLSDNLISGSIPTEIGRSIRLYRVFVTRNNITSTLPTEIGLLTRLRDLGIANNQITGSLPEELTNLTVLGRFIADHNQLTGVIPSRIGNMGTLAYLNLDNNLLGGTVPTELGFLKQLMIFTGSGNSFTGTVPSQVCRNRKHAHQSGSNRLLKDLEMDCAVGADGGVEIVCPENCCTVCCDSQGTNCKELIVD